MIESNSQAGQDLFVLYSTNYKTNGYFLEIGSNDYKKINNTYILENNFNWNGILIEYDKKYLDDYLLYRKNSKSIIDDATKIDYRNLLKDYPTNFDYLQIDLEVVNSSTINCLEKLNSEVFDTHKFAVVTFEHDFYRGDYFNTRKRSREIFNDRNYILVFPDVKNQNNCFEDWYLHPDLIDNKIISKIKTNESLEWTEIIKKF